MRGGGEKRNSTVGESALQRPSELLVFHRPERKIEQHVFVTGRKKLQSLSKRQRGRNFPRLRIARLMFQKKSALAEK